MRGFIAEKEGYILDKVSSARPMKILHVGCATSPNHVGRWESGRLLHSKLVDVAQAYGGKCVGIDLDSDAIKYLKSKMPGEDLRVIDAHHLGKYFDSDFDFIVAGDVIEHLSNPGRFLGECKGILKASGLLIISTANSFSIIRFLKSFLNHEAVHSEHTAYYSHKTLRRLLFMEGLIIKEAGYYRCESLAGDFSINRAVSNFLETGACLVWPQHAEGVLVCAAKSV